MAKRNVRAEAADLLACLASQPDRVVIDGFQTRWGTIDVPGGWAMAARALAFQAIMSRKTRGFDGWREMYAEAEARLREAAR